MKKISILFTALALIFSMTGCRRNRVNETTTPTVTPTTRATVPATTAPQPTMDMIPDATGNIGDRDDGIVGNAPDETQSDEILPTESYGAAEEATGESRIRSRGMMGNIN